MIQDIIDYFESLTIREQLILAIGIPIATLSVIFILGTQPLWDQQQILKQQLQSEQTFNQWFRQNQRTLKNNTIQFDWQNQSLPSLIESSVRQDGLTAWQSRIYQNREEQMVVSFNEVPFKKLAAWLNRLQSKYQVVIVSARFNDTKEAGIINAELTLGKPE